MKTSLVRASAFGTLLLTLGLTSCVDPYGYGYGGGYSCFYKQVKVWTYYGPEWISKKVCY